MKRQPLSAFHAVLWLVLGVLGILFVTFGLYVQDEKRIDRSNDHRLQALSLAGELRQSSDDLTRMAQSFVVTGEVNYQRDYQRILDVREGRASRPAGHPEFGDTTVPLLSLLQQVALTAEESKILAMAKQRSDELMLVEAAAMQAALAGRRDEAIGMLYGNTYRTAKASIMQLIDDFRQQVDQRTYDAVRQAEREAFQMRVLLIVTGCLLVMLLWRLRKELHGSLGGSVNDIYEHITHLGRGDFTAPIPLSHDKDSIMAWLAELQSRLRQMDAERQKGVEQLRASEEFYQAIADNGRALVWMAGLDKLCNYFNQPWLNFTGRQLEQEMGYGWTEGVHPEDFDRCVAIYESAFDRQEYFSMVYRLRRHDGEYRWILDEGTPRFGRNSEFQGYVGHCLDVTAQKLAEEELIAYRDHLEELVDVRTLALARAKEAAEAANVAKSAFLANMSHELRTPLNAVTGMAFLMRRSPLEPGQLERLSKIETAAKHLLEVINSILDLSKIEAGKFELESLPVDLKSITANVCAMLSERAQAKSLEMVTHIDVPPCDFMGDPLRLQQALLNYVSNALKFTDVGQIAIRITADAAEETRVLVRFSVEDTGIGITPDELERLFAAFEQADNSMTRKYGGTGLGLTITRHLAQLMGGEAGVSSVPGAGSTFWFTAWLAKAQPLAESSMPAAFAADPVS